MPLVLRLGVVASIVALAVDAYFWAAESVSFLGYSIATFNLVVIALLVNLHRRTPTVTDWVRSAALTWGVFGCCMPFLDFLEFMDGSNSSLSTVVLGVVLLLTYVATKLPPGSRYLAEPPSNKSLEQARDR